MNKLKEECIAQIINFCNSPNNSDMECKHVPAADIEGTGMWPVLTFMNVKDNMTLSIRPDMGGRVSVCKYCAQLYWHYDPEYDTQVD